MNLMSWSMIGPLTRGEALSKAARMGMASIGLAMLAVGCSRDDSGRNVGPVVRPVKSMVVSAAENVRLRSLPGKVEAANQVELAFQVPGLLVHLPVDEGQRVAAGEVIARLREDEFQARLKTLQAQLDQARAGLAALQLGERPEERLRRESQVRAAEARLANARADYERMGHLVVTNAVSRSEYERSETAYRVAEEDYEAALQLLEKGLVGREEEIQAQEAAVRALEGRVAEAAIQLADCTLRAPYHGVVSQVFVRLNQSIRASEPAVKFQNVDEIDIAVDVPESIMVSDLRAADIVELTAEFSGVPGRRFPVSIREVAQAADPVTQTFTVRVAMPAPEGLTLLPGMTASVTMATRPSGGAGERLLVPASAVYTDSSGESVTWVIGSDDVVTRRPVTLGEATGGEIEVVAGLEPGERIAVAGVTFLRDGMKVRDLGDALGGGRS
jgi:RND family efflux transporter MFP subunit